MNELTIYHNAIDAIAFIRTQEQAKKELGRSYRENVVKLYALTLLTLIDIKATTKKADKKVSQLQIDFKDAGMSAAKAKRLIELAQGMRRKEPKVWSVSRTPDDLMEEFGRYGLSSETEIRKYVTGAKAPTFAEKLEKLIKANYTKQAGEFEAKNKPITDKDFNELVQEWQACFDSATEAAWKMHSSAQNFAGGDIDNGQAE